MNKKTIMVVDDDDEVREAVSELLENHGYAVIPASNGREALDELQIRHMKPAMILLDVMMPVMDGRSFCAEQQSDPEIRDIPVVVFTAFGAALDKMTEVESMPRLDKPVRAEQLLDSVELWSDESKMRN
jgi:CheY-like chemotaxis protein